jgi:hypothetical protein
VSEGRVAGIEARRGADEVDVKIREKTQWLVDVAMDIGRWGEGRRQSWQQTLDTLNAYVVEAEFKYGHHVMPLLLCGLQTG